MSTLTRFGPLLRTLRKRAGMTQGDLAAAVGYSVAAISALEQERRLPVVEFVVQSLVPALALADAPQLATQLVELAAMARGERPPTSITIQHTAQVVIREEVSDQPQPLPALPTALIGRTAQVNQLCDRLLGHGGRLLTLVGPPGIGKTTLALAVAAQVQLHYRDGAVFVALAVITEPTLMAATIATAVGCSDASAKPPQVRLIEFLRRKTMLLVLDNLEQLDGAAPLLAELLAACPGVCVLATSRERLHLRAEQRFKVPPLELAAAVDLFVQRAQAVDVDFRLTRHNQSTIEMICQRLDCLPLALELCAAQTDLFAPAQLLTQLQTHPLDLLIDGASDLPAHQRTLRITIDHSHRLLAEEERTLLRCLATFVGGCDFPAIEGVALADTKLSIRPLYSLLHALIGKNLIHSELTPSGQPRFRLLETIRQYALAQQRVHGEEQQLQERHAIYFLELAKRSALQLQEGDKKMALDQLEGEIDNLRAAFHHLLTFNAVGALRLATVLSEFWYLRDYYSEGRTWLAQALAQTSVDTTPEMLTLRGWAMLAAAQLASHQGDGRQAEWLSEESIAGFRQVGDQRGLAEALRESGWILHTYDTNIQAIQRFEESLLHFRQLKLTARIADVLGALAQMYLYVSPSDERVRRSLQESISLYQTLNDTNGMAQAMFAWAEIENAAGHYEEAATLAGEVYLRTEQLGNKQHCAYALALRGEANLHLGRWELAEFDLQNAYKLFTQIGNGEGQMVTLRSLGNIKRRRGDGVAAGEHYRRSLQLSLKPENGRILACCLVGLGGVALMEGAPYRAALLLSAAQQRLDRYPPFLAPIDQREVDQMINDTRCQLDEEAFAQAWTVGQLLPLSQLIV